MATAPIHYSVEYLKSCRKAAYLCENYSKHELGNAVRGWIIALEIRRHPRPYRRSKGGARLFYKITTILNRRKLMHSHLLASTLAINNTNLLNINIVKEGHSGNRSLSVTFGCHCALLNCRSAVNKMQTIQAEIINNNIDICALTETWFSEEENEVLSHRLCPSGYKCISVPCKGHKGGGIALVHRANLHIEKSTPYEYTTMECTDFNVNLDKHSVLMSIIYRPPDSSVLQFANEFAQHMECTINTKGNMLLIGDFNVHMNALENSDTILFNDILESFNLCNRVFFSTHRLNNILDLVIENDEASRIRNLSQGHLLSDHHMVLFEIATTSRVPLKKMVAYRKLKGINPTEFGNDVSAALKDQEQSISISDPDDLVQCYNNVLKDVLNNQAPLKRKSVSTKQRLPWYNDEIANEIRTRCKQERSWRCDPSNKTKFTIFYNQRRLVSNLMDNAERSYYTSKLTENKSNFKEIFNICNNLLGRNKDLPLPPSEDNQSLANSFNEYFCEKIEKIHTGLIAQNACRQAINTQPDGDFMVPPFTSFKEMDAEYITKLVSSCPTKSCELDPIPMSLLKKILPTVSMLLTQIVNASLSSGLFPKSFKEALIRPLLKKLNLPLINKNYRPVSNLAFVGKLIERVVADQLNQHINQHSLMEENQSAYRSHHSTETTLIKVKADVLKAMDNQEVVCLVLLDLSTAFDTVDHSILLN